MFDRASMKRLCAIYMPPKQNSFSHARCSSACMFDHFQTSTDSHLQACKCSPADGSFAALVVQFTAFTNNLSEAIPLALTSITDTAQSSSVEQHESACRCLQRNESLSVSVTVIVYVCMSTYVFVSLRVCARPCFPADSRKCSFLHKVHTLRASSLGFRATRI